MPCLHLRIGGAARPVFQDSRRENAEPNQAPEILLKTYWDTAVRLKDDDSSPGEAREEHLVLERDDEGYDLPLQHSLTGPEEMAVCLAEMHYTLAEKDYVSVTAFYVER